MVLQGSKPNKRNEGKPILANLFGAGTRQSTVENTRVSLLLMFVLPPLPLCFHLCQEITSSASRDKDIDCVWNVTQMGVEFQLLQ